MPRKDPPSSEKHIRFGDFQSRPWLAEALPAVPGVVAIVLHKRGKQSENPHLHVYWTGASITKVTWKNRAVARDDRFASLSGQNDWTIITHNCFHNWATYVTNDATFKGVEVLFGPQMLHDLLAMKSQQVSPTAEQVEETCNAIVEKAEAKLSEWDKLLDYFQLQQQSATWCSNRIMKEIKKYYLQRLRPIPRHGDLTRYAYSLYVILRMVGDKVDDVLMAEADADFA